MNPTDRISNPEVSNPEVTKDDAPVSKPKTLGQDPEFPPQGRDSDMSAFLDAVRAFPMAEFEAHALDLAMEEACAILRTHGPQFLEGDEGAGEKVTGAFEQILMAQVFLGRSHAARKEDSDG